MHVKEAIAEGANKKLDLTCKKHEVNPAKDGQNGYSREWHEQPEGQSRQENITLRKKISLFKSSTASALQNQRAGSTLTRALPRQRRYGSD